MPELVPAPAANDQDPADMPSASIRFAQIKTDAIEHRERIAQIDPASFATVADLATFVLAELGGNVYGTVEANADAMLEDVVPELVDLADQVDGLSEGDVLSPETSSQILGVFTIGREICNLLENATKHAEKVTKLRARRAIDRFREHELAARELVEEITIQPEPQLLEDPDDPDDGPDESSGGPEDRIEDREPYGAANPDDPLSSPEGA